MKKFLVILLSLAVLFGFAACDNSSSTPDTSEEEQGTSVDYSKIATMGTTIAGDVGTMFGAFKANETIITAGEVVDPTTTDATTTSFSVATENTYTSVSYSKVVKGITDVEDESYTLTITGVDTETKSFTEVPERTVNLSTYTLTFSRPADVANKDFTRIEGTISGFVTGTLTAEIDACGKVTELAVGAAAPVAYLPEVVAKATGVKYGEAEVSPEYLLANINKNSNSTVKNYNDVKDTAISNAKAAITDYVKLLLGGTDTTTLAALVNPADGLLAEGSKVTGTYDATGAGTATVTFKADDTPLPLVTKTEESNITQSIYLPANGSLVIEFTGKTTEEATNASFNIESFKIVSGTVLACKANNLTAADTFDSITLAGITGDASGKVESNSATSNAKVSKITTLVFTASSVDAGTAEATVKGINPEYGAAAQLVKVDYATYAIK